MQLKSLFPWSGHSREDRAHPLSPLRDEIDRLFESFPSFGTSLRDMEGRARAFSPSIDITENDKRIKVKADLPGMEEKDIDLVLSENTLVIKGEKTEEHEDKDDEKHVLERVHGSFQRRIQLPEGIDREKIDAHFHKGVLTIVLPKNPELEKESSRKIPVRGKS